MRGKHPFCLENFMKQCGGGGRKEDPQNGPPFFAPKCHAFVLWSAHLCFPHRPDWFFLLENRKWKSYQAAHSSNCWNCPFHLLSGCQITKKVTTKKKEKPLGYFRAYERFGFLLCWPWLPTKAKEILCLVHYGV